MLHPLFSYRTQTLVALCVLASFALATKLCVPLHAQSLDSNLYKEAGLPFLQNFDAKTYGGHEQNWSMLQDDRGLVYIGNLPGVLVFDGARWQSISTPNNSVVRSLDQDAAGTIYVGAHTELGYLRPDSLGQMVYHSLLEHIPPEERTFTNVWKVHATPDGIYFRTSSHLFRWADNQMGIWKPESEFHRSFWIYDTFYIRAWDVGLFSMQGDSLTMVPNGEQFADLRLDVMLPFGDNQLLVGTRRDGLFLSGPEGYVPFETEADTYLKENQIYDGLVLSDQTLVFATLRGGLVHIDQQGRFLRVVDKSAGLPDNTIWALGTDAEMGLWLMLNKGLSRVELPSPISNFTDAQGLEGSVESLSIYNGELYAATSLGVYRMNRSTRPGNPPAFDVVGGIATQAWSLLPTGNELLVATSSGVFQIDNDRVTRLTEDLSFFLHRSAIDPSRIYVGLGNGLGILERAGQGWRFSGRFHGTIEEIRTIAEDREGNVWFGTQFQGVVQVKANDTLPVLNDTTLEVVRFDDSHDMPGGEIKVSVAAGEVFFDSPNGLLNFDEQRQRFVAASELATFFPDTTLTVQRVFEDDQARLWVVRTGQGKREFSRLTPTRNGGYEVTPLPLQRLSDMGPFWAVYPDPREPSILWLGGDDGLARVDTDISKNEGTSYQALIRKVLVNQDSLISGGARAPRNATEEGHTAQANLSMNTAVRFEFAAPTFDAPSETQFQYKLEGYDDEWSLWTTETVKEYTNLFADTYQFRVRARNLYRQVSEEDSFTFAVLSPWYLSWWAYILYAIPLLGGLFFVDRFQRSRLIKRERLRSEVEQAKLKTSAAQLHARTLQAENELLNAELRFLSVVESANDAIVSANQDGEIIFWNKQAEKVFGHLREDILGKPLTLLMPERHKASHERGLKRFIDTGKKSAIGRVIELDGLRKDGTEFPLQLSLSSWSTEEEIFFSAILRDITDQKEAEQELLRVQNQLAHSKKMASLGKLTAGIAHEIKNPLNFVNNFAQLTSDLVDEVGELIEENKTKSVEDINAALEDTLVAIKRNAEAINRHGHRADSIVKSMMNHAGGGVGQPQSADVNDLVEVAIELAHEGWLNENTQSEFDIERDFDPDTGHVRLVPQEISRVLVNVLENAFYALHLSEKDNLKPRVRIETKRSRDFVDIHVIDNGPGIPADNLDHIFDPFFTTKPAGKGTGLGLSLSYDIVTQGHGGQLVVDSTLGKGSTFTIRLPV